MYIYIYIYIYIYVIILCTANLLYSILLLPSHIYFYTNLNLDIKNNYMLSLFKYLFPMSNNQGNFIWKYIIWTYLEVYYLIVSYKFTKYIKQ